METSLKSSFRAEKVGDLAFGLLCLTTVFTLFELRSFVYFRDYSIAFEGAYRLFLGQVPFRDFGSPVGPGAFVIPALFFKLFGANWNVFLLTQQFLNAVMLLMVYLFLQKLYIRTWVIRLSMIAFSVGYLVFQSHPWYNSTGFLLLLAAALCALQGGVMASLAAGTLSGLAILTKQDFGLLSVLISGALVLRSSLGTDYEKILPDNKSLFEKRTLALAAFNLSVFTSALAGSISLFIFYTDPSGFTYWFNYGQAPHDHRGITFRDLVANSFGTLGILLTALAVMRNNFRILVAAVFLTASSVSRTTSGLGFTHYYFVAFIPILLYECWHLQIRYKRLLLFILLVATIRVVIKPLSDLRHVLVSIARQQPEHFFFDYKLLSLPLVETPVDLLAFSNHTQMPQETIALLRHIKEMVLQRQVQNSQLTQTPPVKLLNMTELTPVYSELGVAPPKHLPLWFHTKVSLFPEQIQDINNQLADTAYDYIMIQGTHEGLTETYRKFLATLNSNTGYHLESRVHASPFNATWPCEPDCQGDIYLYAKR
jgi:hypothetical protein